MTAGLQDKKQWEKLEGLVKVWNWSIKVEGSSEYKENIRTKRGRWKRRKNMAEEVESLSEW